MDLISWSLNAIDQIYTTKKMGEGEPSCPKETFAAGYVLDSWNKWRAICMPMLSVEDVEDIYIFGFMITGFLLIGAGGYLLYRKVCERLAAVSAFEKLPIIEGLARHANTQTQSLCELDRKMTKMGDNMEKLMSQPGMDQSLD